MKAFLASLLAASAIAGTNYLIEETSEMLTWTGWDSSTEEDYTWAAETLTLETTETTDADDNDIIVFCFTVEDDAWTEAEDITAVFGVAWTDGEEYVDADTTDTDAVVILGAYADSAWTWYVYDDIDTAADDGTVSSVWAEYEDDSDWSLTDGDAVSGTICVSRDLEEADEFDLPFADGSEFIAYYEFIAFQGVVYSGAMSLGLALASAAGAALALM